jgi:hypothetical protein
MKYHNKIRIDVYATAEEYQRVQKSASDCGLSLSSYFMKLALNGEVKSSLDKDLILALIKESANLGRLGGLLKLGLSQEKLDRFKGNKVLNEILEQKQRLEKKILAL